MGRLVDSTSPRESREVKSPDSVLEVIVIIVDIDECDIMLV
jgi:hypothetical protein